MRTLRWGATTVAAALLFVACGDSTGPAVERNEQGTGTRTLRIVADIEGQEAPGGFVTGMNVEVRDAQGNPVSGATVTIRNDDLGTVNLLENGTGSGDYTATVNTFAFGDYRLDVVQDTNNVRDVVVGGIAVHAILSPSTSDTVPANQSLTVVWERLSEAAGADVESRDFEAQGIPDTGTYTIPASAIQVRADERVRVKRYNEVLMAGGLAGSRLKLEIQSTVEPVLVQ
jgi:hypothetical protein